MAEIINNINEQDKLVRVSFIKGILERIYSWMPFTKTNKNIVFDNDYSVGFGKSVSIANDTVVAVGLDDEKRKNALEIKNDGMIYIITDIKSKSVSSLQDALNDKGAISCSSYEEMVTYMTADKIGTLLYLKFESPYNGNVYVPGLYVISMDAITSSPSLSRLGTTSSTELDLSETVNQLKDGMGGLTKRVVDLEDWVDSEVWEDEAITKNELNNIIKNN